jgi:hypothetical protein
VTDDQSDEQEHEARDTSRADVERRLAHFRHWQHAMGLDEAAAAQWAAEVRAERRAGRL